MWAAVALTDYILLTSQFLEKMVDPFYILYVLIMHSIHAYNFVPSHIVEWFEFLNNYLKLSQYSEFQP